MDLLVYIWSPAVWGYYYSSFPEISDFGNDFLLVELLVGFRTRYIWRAGGIHPSSELDGVYVG